MGHFIRRVWYIATGRRQEFELAEELAFHREMKAQELRDRGVSENDVAAATQRALGNDVSARQRARDMWVWPWLQDITQDVRFGMRMLIKERRFAMAAILTLALGIAVNNAVFTIINTALLRDLPFERSNRLVTIQTHDPRGFDSGVSYLDFLDFQSQTSAFETLAGRAGGSVNISDTNPAERLSGSYGTANLFRTLRSAPFLGRDFSEEDNRPGAPAVTIISYGLWQSRYGGEAHVLGRAVRVNGTAATVIGVMPEGFGYPLAADLWLPLEMLPGLHTAPRNATTLTTVGRLQDSSSKDQANSETSTIAARIAQAHPETSKDLRVSVSTLKEVQAQGGARFLFTILGAVSVVLLIACANVANLLLARSAHRAREIAVRSAMGASRWRIVRQLLIECMLIAAAAGAVGLYLSFYASSVMASAFDAVEIGAPDQVHRPYWVNLTMDHVAWMFLAGVCLFASLAAGLVPALQLSRTNANEVLKAGGRTGPGTPSSRRMTSGLTVAQIALALMLLTSAGIFARSFMALYMKDLLIDTSNIVTTRVVLPQEKYASLEQKRAFYQTLDDRLTGMSVFTATTIGSDIPLQPLGFGTRALAVSGREPGSGQKPEQITYVNVGARYFETLGLGITRGRALQAEDSLTGREGAIVNERFVQKLFPDADPLGQRIQMTPGVVTAGAAIPWLTIVGVVPTLPNFFPDRMADPVVYAPLDAEAAPQRAVSVIVRAPSKAIAAASLRQEMRALDPDLPLFAIQTMDEAVARARWPVRVIGSWFLALAIIAITLSSVGLYAITAHGVAQRSQEIGVRMALGAESRQVIWLFIRRTLMQLALGVALGLAGTLALSGMLRNIVREVDPRDPLTLVVVSVILTVFAIGASILPARRAARVDPVEALRAD